MEWPKWPYKGPILEYQMVTLSKDQGRMIVRGEDPAEFCPAEEQRQKENESPGRERGGGLGL